MLRKIHFPGVAAVGVSLVCVAVMLLVLSVDTARVASVLGIVGGVLVLLAMVGEMCKGVMR